VDSGPLAFRMLFLTCWSGAEAPHGGLPPLRATFLIPREGISMSSGRYFVVGVALAALVVVVSTRTYHRGRSEIQPAAVVPGTPAALLPSANASSCKPLPPLQVGVTAASPAGGDLWTLRLLSADADRDVVVWMSSGTSDRRAVWRGRLSRGVESQVDVHFAASTGAGQVRVEMEPAQPSGGELTVRGEAIAAVPGRVGAALVTGTPGVAAGRLRVNPQTGESVLEFPAQVEGSSGSGSGGNR
jgi:hypothetical protein